MKLEFQTNVPIEVCLISLDGEAADSKFGGLQRKFSTTDRDIFYVSESVGNIIADTCRKLRIEEREPVVICKAEVPDGKGRKQIRWQVARVNAPVPSVGPQPGGGFAVEKAPFANTNGANGSYPPAPIAAPTTQKQAEPMPLSQQSNGNAGQPPVNGHAAAPLPADRAKTKLEDALVTVIAACHAARNYAKDIGYDMPTFNGDEICRMVNTLMIQNGSGHAVNGGAR